MINKTIIQGIITVALFFGLWFGLSQLDFVKFFRVEEVSNNTESKIGDLIWDEISDTNEVIYDDSVKSTLDSLVNPICKMSNIDRDSLKVHIVVNSEVNAFALPNNHLVVYTGLIEACKKQEALQGVLGHEIAHLEGNHVMKKLSKEIGLSVILSATTGSKGGAAMKQLISELSSSAYDRSLEEEADIKSVRYMIRADINPEPMADFMYQLSTEEKLPGSFYWIATHPESEERAKYILGYLKGKKYEKRPTLTEKQWQQFKDLIDK